jgi:hypothetical protein
MKIDLEKFLSENPKVNKIVVNQYFGLGDILFIEPIYRHLKFNLGLEVIAPIQDQYLWLKDNIKYVNFIGISEFNMDYERFDFGLFKSTTDEIIEDTAYLPLRFSDQIYRDLKPHDSSASRFWMSDKYTLLGLNYSLWESIHLERDLQKEEKLKSIILKEIGSFDYIFCNSFYQNSMNINLNLESRIKTDIPIISMSKIEGFSMIDWAGIIQEAKSVHTVSTSLIYMIPCIYQKEKEYHIYPRLPEKGFYTVEEFLPNYWIKHFEI